MADMSAMDDNDNEPGSPEFVHSFTMMQKEHRAASHARRGANVSGKLEEININVKEFNLKSLKSEEN